MGAQVLITSSGHLVVGTNNLGGKSSNNCHDSLGRYKMNFYGGDVYTKMGSKGYVRIYDKVCQSR